MFVSFHICRVITARSHLFWPGLSQVGNTDPGGHISRLTGAPPEDRAGADLGETMKQELTRISSDDAGMSTAEYAVGTVAAAGFGGLLIKLLSSPEAQDLIWNVLTRAFSWLG